MAPTNLTVIDNGLGSLQISWTSNITIEEVAVDYFVIARATGNPDIPQIVEWTTLLHQVIMSPDNFLCAAYSIQVTANNSAGSSSPSEIITMVFPSLPLVESSIAHTLTKMEDGITLSVTLNVRKQHFLAISHILCDRMFQFAIKIPIHLHCNNIIIQNKFFTPCGNTQCFQLSE